MAALVEDNSRDVDAAVLRLDTLALVNALLLRIERVPFRDRKAFAGGSPGNATPHSVLKMLLEKGSHLLGDSYLKVHLKTSVPRDVNASDWNTLEAVHRSERGTTGIYFLQTSQHEVVVAKPMTREEFELVNFVNEFSRAIFKISAPTLRLISKESGEYAALESGVKSLFFPLHADVYESGGSDSPRGLFTSSNVCLMSYVKGQPLTHASAGQRPLEDADWHALGSLYLLDLLLHNTDRLPCRRAIPRSGAHSLEDQGNPGNVMFLESPGSLFSIDPEFKFQMDPQRESEYFSDVAAVVDEILHDHHRKAVNKAIDSLFFQPVAGLAGIIDQSLEELTPWSRLPHGQRVALESVLDLIRLQAVSEDGVTLIVPRAGPPPEGTVEHEWREWVRKVCPRVLGDLFDFIRLHTGLPINEASASVHFKAGFKESLVEAFSFGNVRSFDKIGSWGKLIASITDEIDVSFVTRLVAHLTQFDVRRKLQGAFKNAALLSTAKR